MELRARRAWCVLRRVALRGRVAVGLGWTRASHWLGLATATATTAVVARS